MKRSKKIMLWLIPVLLLVVVVASSSVFGFSNFSPENIEDVGSGTKTDAVTGAVNNVWGTVLLILQIAAVAAIVFAGVRYMFASADQKADIKKSLIILVVGAVLVFGASTIVSFIVTATQEITNVT